MEQYPSKKPILHLEKSLNETQERLKEVQEELILIINQYDSELDFLNETLDDIKLFEEEHKWIDDNKESAIELGYSKDEEYLNKLKEIKDRVNKSIKEIEEYYFKYSSYKTQLSSLLTDLETHQNKFKKILLHISSDRLQ